MTDMRAVKIFPQPGKVVDSLFFAFALTTGDQLQQVEVRYKLDDSLYCV